MIFRLCRKSDIDDAFAIINCAKEYIRSQGFDQWQNGYPARENIESDVLSGIGYVLEDNGVIAAYVAVSENDEPYLHSLVGGTWTEGSFAIWHRVAVKSDYRSKGVSDELVSSIEQLCREMGKDIIRVDTHTQNSPMRSLVERSGYRLVGTVTLDGIEAGATRVAYELILK